MDCENKYGTLDLQRELLIMLKKLNEFCIENDIRYSLAYGSLLGAIRHKGFIPWDDDVDVIMSREEFKKFQRLIVYSPDFEWDYLSPKALWVGRVKSKQHKENSTNIPPIIDIFILDNVPDNKILAKFKLMMILFFMGTVKGKPDLSRFKFVMKLMAFCTWLFGLILPNKMKFTVIEKLSEMGNKKNTQKVSCYNTVFHYMGYTFSSQMMTDYKLMPFEDASLMVMNGYDEFLTVNYGDYMTPPKDKFGHHLHPEYGFKYK